MTRRDVLDLLHQLVVLVAALVALTFGLRWLGGL
jgi:hypothetical protein